MYAVIESGGKQYRVSEGQTLKVESLPLETGQAYDFDKVLLIGTGESIKIGQPYLEAKVSATIVEHGRDKKITIYKIRRRKHYRRKMGHRQNYTEVKITQIANL